MPHFIIPCFFNTRLLLFSFGIFLIFLSILGPPKTGIFPHLISLNFDELFIIYENSETFFRMPDTLNRILVFMLSIILLVFSSIIPVSYNTDNRKTQNIFAILSSIFFLSILTTDSLYNIVIILLFTLSIYHYACKANNKFKSYEILFLLAYLILSIFPFFHSFLISSNIAEVDNYTRFLLAIPLYLMIRDLNFNKKYFLYLINISAILLLPISLHFYFTEDLLRIRLFTSSATILGNISMTFFLFAVLSIYFFKKHNLNYVILPYMSSLAALFSWGLSGSRFTIIIPMLILLLSLMNNNSRKYISFLFDKKNLLFLFILFSVFFSSISFDRFTNLNLSSLSNYDEPNANYWMKQDSIIPRLLIWNGAINIIKENPVIGVGLDNFNNHLNKQILEGKIEAIRKDLNNPTAGLNHAHSQYLDSFAKMGILGFLVLLLFMFFNFYFFYRSCKESKVEIYPIFGFLFIFIHSVIMINDVILSHHQSTIFMVYSLVFFAGLSMPSKSRGGR